MIFNRRNYPRVLPSADHNGIHSETSCVDDEMLFHGKTLVLYFLGIPTDDLGVLASELSTGREFNALFNSVLDIAAPVASCGCSGGGCSAKSQS